jgi:hypothetical protein
MERLEAGDVFTVWTALAKGAPTVSVHLEHWS